MTFFTPFLHFNINPAFAVGNYFGACLNQRICSSIWATANSSNAETNTSLSSSQDFSSYPQFTSNGFGIGFPQMNYFAGFGFNNFTMPTGMTNMFNTVNNWGNFSNWSFPSLTTKISSPKTNSTTLKDYNSEKGKRLAEDAKSHVVGFTGYCARYVYNALERTGLNTGMERANGYYLAAQFRKNPNFKEVSVDSVNWKNLPAGCILLFKPGSQGYDEEVGHVEISTGEGTCVSDGIAEHIKKPDTIFIPV